MITSDQLIAALFPSGSAKSPTPEQRAILAHPGGPAWVLAGPGSGKTEVLALFALRLMYVGGEPFQPTPVSPASVLITTFTDKAAKNLEDRIGRYRSVLIAAHPNLALVDTSDLKVGTLHGLCNDLLQEYRAASYQNVRLMDEFEQAMFIYEHMSAVKSDNLADHSFWASLEFLFTPRQWKASYPYLPAKWVRAGVLVRLFNRIAEDRVDVTAMLASSGPWKAVAMLYQEYCGHLKSNHRCDFSQLQVHFLDFLSTPVGRSFLEGVPGAKPGIQWVLVDEYQDTNLVQEAIYFAMARHKSHNLVVVGDDDQAMYRFRGGSVECMVTFDEACKVHLGVSPAVVRTYPLASNFRSHPRIVSFFNEYISAFPSMQQPGARVPGKPAMSPKSKISGSYEAVGILEGRTLDEVAGRFALAIKDLVDQKVVNDASQCCLLLNSTRESPMNAGKYVDALKAIGLKVYNPRNKAYLQQEEVLGLLGALLAMLDPTGAHVPDKPVELNEFILDCRSTYHDLANSHPALRAYVDACVKNIAKHAAQYVDTSLQELAYLLLSCPPFDQWHDDPVRRVRLARLTSLLESFASMPVPGLTNVQRGHMRVDPDPPYAINTYWMRNFYFLFFGYLSRSGMDEVADDEVICPPGYVPVMTIHQAKGLEFPFVFVGHLSETPDVGDAHTLESEMAAFPGNPQRTFKLAAPEVRAELDRIRQFYVAYSRAEYALILVGTKGQVTNAKGTSTPCGPKKGWLAQRLINL